MGAWGLREKPAMISRFSRIGYRFCSSFPGGERALVFALARFVGCSSVSEPSRALRRFFASSPRSSGILLRYGSMSCIS